MKAEEFAKHIDEASSGLNFSQELLVTLAFAYAKLYVNFNDETFMMKSIAFLNLLTGNEGENR